MLTYIRQLRAESPAGDSKRDGVVSDNIPERRIRRNTGREDIATFFHMKKRKKHQRARLTVQIFGVCGGGGPAQLLWIVLSMTRVYGSGGGGPTMFSDKSIAKHAYKFNSIKSHNLSDKAYRKEKPQRLLGIYNYTNNDPSNCGQCGNKCDPGAPCEFGMCGYAAPSSQPGKRPRRPKRPRPPPSPKSDGELHGDRDDDE
ncbi:hypothetical protein Bca52824_033504 [Brassica carinata]|uniref:Uncharacterized protein n=1 Tax=Brassica carinata TaxID=52824 RepID=A0A8X7SCM8_BRACI|nr:hypothetical protein Bca52824_033504 [Brassica carinata]